MVGMMGLIILSFAIANFQSIWWITSEWMVSTILPAVIVAETNDERKTGSLSLLARNEVLDTAAQLKAEHMADNGYFSHYSPDGTSPWHWFSEVSYSYLHAGENLAVHFTDSSEVVAAWMRSPTHRENIMNTQYQEIGIGVAKGEYEGHDTVFVVQLFGTKKAEAAPAAPVIVATEELSDLDINEPTTTPTVSDEGVVLALNESEPVAEEVEPPSVETPSAEPGETAAEPIDSLGIQSASSGPAVAADTASGINSSEDQVVISSTEIEEVAVIQDRVVVYSDHVSTSTAGVPAYINRGGEETTKPVLTFATQPQKVLQFLYLLIGLFVAVALSLSIVIEIRRQEPVQIAYGTGLIAVMFLLFYIHVNVSQGILIV